MKALFHVVNTKEARSKRPVPHSSNDLGASDTSTSTLTAYTAVRIIDRIALLACALVDPSLLDKWFSIASPITAANRPATLD